MKVYARSAVKAADPTPSGTDINRDVSSDAIIRIDNPDDPYGPPAYEGPVAVAHTMLTPGIYAVAAHEDGNTEITPTPPTRCKSGSPAPPPTSTIPRPTAPTPVGPGSTTPLMPPSWSGSAEPPPPCTKR